MKILKMVQNGQIGLKWSKMVQNGPKWSKFVQIGKKLSNFFKRVKNGQTRSKIVKNGLTTYRPERPKGAKDEVKGLQQEVGPRRSP